MMWTVRIQLSFWSGWCVEEGEGSRAWRSIWKYDYTAVEQGKLANNFIVHSEFLRASASLCDVEQIDANVLGLAFSVETNIFAHSTDGRPVAGKDGTLQYSGNASNSVWTSFSYASVCQIPRPGDLGSFRREREMEGGGMTCSSTPFADKRSQVGHSQLPGWR